MKTNAGKHIFSWTDLPQPFTVLAPMEDVTDSVFRRIIATCAPPDVFFTEFMSCEGFQSVGREKVALRLKYTEDERPVIAQIWGIHPESFYETAKELVRMGFDGIDINMGCPQKTVVKTGGAGALIDNPLRAGEIISAARAGMDHAGGQAIPLSVKTRIGTKYIKTEEWISFLLQQNIQALTVHGRTVKEQSGVPAHWDEIAKAVHIRDQMNVPIPIIGNGDIVDYGDGFNKHKKYKVNGVMIGRGIFRNPWAFEQESQHHTVLERLDLSAAHLNLFEQTWSGVKPFNIMKKFFKIYISDFTNASVYRERLMLCETFADAGNVLELMRAELTAA